MYKVYAEKLFSGGRVLIYMNGNISDDTKALSPKLTLSENNAGDFTIKLPSTNAGYDFVDRLDTLITVEKDNEEIWKGRIITIKEDFKKNKTITCEGEFAYLNDTIQPQEEYLDQTLRTIYEKILNNHNSKDARFGAYKQFKPGTSNAMENTKVTTTYTNYETTMKALNDKFLENYGGYFHIRKNNGSRYLDYIPENQRPVSSQVIEFGTNLLDFTKSYDATDFCTVILPLGARINDEYGIDEGEIDKVQAYTTIELVNVGSPYLVNGPAVEQFGWIERVVHFDDIDDPYALYWAAVDHMKEIIFEKLVLEVNAVDLGYFGADYKNIALSEKVRVKSKPHDLDMYFPVKKISIPLDNPANTTFTIGNAVKSSLTLKTVVDQGDTDDKLDRIPTEDHTLMLAKRKAAEIIDSFTMGFITIIKNQNGSQELYVTDTAIPERYDNIEDSATYIANLCQHYWRWNLHGLAYYNKNDVRYNNPKGLRTAITMDGAIVADFLTVGTIRGGDSYWDLSNGIFYLSAGVKTPDGTLGDMQSTLTHTVDGLELETKRLNQIVYGQDTPGDYNSSGGLIGDYTSKISASATSLKTSFNETLYGKGGTKDNPIKGSIVAEYRSSIDQTARDLTTSFDKILYGDGGTKDNPIKGSIVAEYRSKINTSAEDLTIEFNKKLYGTSTDSSGGTSIKSMIKTSADNLTIEFNKELYGQSTVPNQYKNKSIISITSDQISSKVSAGDVSSMIEQSASSIRLKATNIRVVSANFNVTNTGLVTATGMSITKGTIYNEDEVDIDNRSYWCWMRIQGTTIDACPNATNKSGVGSDRYCKIDFANKINDKFGNIQLFARNVVFSSDGICLTESKGNRTVLTGKTQKNVVYTGDDNNTYRLEFIHGIFTAQYRKKGSGWEQIV